MRWSTGESVVLRDIWHGRIWTAKAARVVSDADDGTILALLPGTPAVVPSGYSPFDSPVEMRLDLLDALERGDWSLRDSPWQRTNALVLLLPEVYYSVLLFFEPGPSRFLCWYVNFQEPLRRTRVGFDTCDLWLDLVVGPDHQYGWKDEDEFAAGIERGIITADHERAVRAAGDAVLQLVETRRPPFDDTWTGWNPDPEWPLPQLPLGWEQLG